MAKTLLAGRPAPHPPAPAASVTTTPGAGTCVISSRIGTADRQAVLDLFTRSSPDTRRDRFHGALSVFPIILGLACRRDRDSPLGMAEASPDTLSRLSSWQVSRAL
jgi:hypothetical protein